MILAVLQVQQRHLVHLAVHGEGILIALVVHPLLEIRHGGNGGAAIDAVHAALGQHADVRQQLLHLADVRLGGFAVDHALQHLHGPGGGRGRGPAGRPGRGGGLSRCLAQGFPLLRVVIQEGQALGVQLAGDLQHVVARQLVDALLEAAHRRHRGRAVAAVCGALGQQAQRDQLALHAADRIGRGALVHGAVVRPGRHLRGGPRRGLGRTGLVEPLLGLGARRAVHAQLLPGLVLLVDVGLEIPDGLAGIGVILAGDLALLQPAQLVKLPLQRANLLGTGIAVDQLVAAAALGPDRWDRRGHRRRGGTLGLLVLLLHVSVVGIVHPRKLRVHQRCEGGRRIGRHRGRGLGDPDQAGVESGALGDVPAGGHRAVEHGDQQHGGHHQHRHGDAGEHKHAALSAALLFLLWLAVALGRRGGGLALGDVGRSVFLKEEVALAGVFHIFHAGAQLLKARFKLVLHARHRHHRAVVQALGAIPWQVFADAQAVFLLRIKGRVDNARGILAQRAADQEAAVVDL